MSCLKVHNAVPAPHEPHSRRDVALSDEARPRTAELSLSLPAERNSQVNELAAAAFFNGTSQRLAISKATLSLSPLPR